MAQQSNTNNIGNEDLICPITYEMFRDPVIAGDGHVYERAAITQWILDNGTSPITREPMSINELLPDDYLRSLAAQRRNSTISGSVQFDPVILTTGETISSNRQATIVHQTRSRVRRSQSRKNYVKPVIIIGVSVLIFIITLTITLSVLNMKYPSANEKRSVYSGTITSALYLLQPSNSTNRYFYCNLEITVSKNGFYKFYSESERDLLGSLYSPSFDKNKTQVNLKISDNDSAGNGQFYFRYSLKSGDSYNLVIKINDCNTTGSYKIVAIGPEMISFK